MQLPNTHLQIDLSSEAYSFLGKCFQEVFRKFSYANLLLRRNFKFVLAVEKENKDGILLFALPHFL